jgi:uncharacterized protein (TIGR02246 family)
MKRLAALLGTSLIALMITACGSSSNHDADVKAIKDFETQWNQDWAAKDADKIAARYSSDAVLIVPGSPAISGKDAILKSLTQMTSDPAMALNFHASKVEVAKSGDLAYTQGTYILAVTDPVSKQVVNDHGNYVTAYRKVPDGTWKAVSDIATSEVPPPVPTQAKAATHGKKAAHAAHVKATAHRRSRKR